jgi:hypothetical protein
MKIFHCDRCRQLVFFENVRCVSCGHALAYLPDRQVMGALEADGDGNWRYKIGGELPQTYRLCRNYSLENVCNWAVRADDPGPYCLSCRLTRVIPDLSQSGHREAWYRLEVAKRRLVYSLLGLGLPLAASIAEKRLVFEFRADPSPPGAAGVMTGHVHGLITIDLAEADDAERERRRRSMHEPYRTALGHFRHEVGHYYWERLVQGSGRLGDFRARFGDERQDYGQALERYYRTGPPAHWQDTFISAYASAHPWEDWAETWAHYLHITDTLETAEGCGLALRPESSNQPAPKLEFAPAGCRPESFDQMIEQWLPLAYVLNNLNRGMGLPDGYPFVLSRHAIEKLRLVHEVIARAAS